jgi:hypothetical protein
VSEICDLVDENSETLRLFRSCDRAIIANLVSDGDRRLLERPAVRAELADWLRPSEGDQCDGICTDSLGIPGPFVAANWVMRNMNIGDLQAKLDRELVDHSSALIMVTADDERVSLIRAGEALERLLLTITSCGLQYSFLNQPIEVSELRTKVQKLVPTAALPQLLIRIGYAEGAIRPAPRRRVETVVQ